MDLLKVNFPRLQDDIETLAAIGRSDDDLGIYRMAFTDNDMQARAWLKSRIEAAGLDCHEDEAANIHARLAFDATRPSVMTGSHLDTVPGAGHLDGALGVMAGLECLRCLKEQGKEYSFALESVAFTDEEGRFGGMLGSQAVSGRITPEIIHQARDLDGQTLTEVMQRRGMTPMNILRARRKPESIQAFVELHIEQGPVLEQHNMCIGAVDAIAGLLRWNIRLSGEANHAGTTPMQMRKDPLQGFAEISAALPRILDENGSPRSTATIGYVNCFPGAANVIPGRVEFSLDMRDTDMPVLDEMAQAFRKAMSAIARRHKLMFEYEEVSRLEAAKCDPGIVEAITAISRQFGYHTMQMHSGAAHDCMMMAGITRTAMIFVPSMAGRSHSPAEWTPWEEIEKGANVLLNTLHKLASEAA
ncbi:MAG: Zn-dependent hydrolase [Gammaproteobacteria bacterium]|nr:Zn-dependent hydrolase [Gammaproteobacteria bacterium]MDH5651802.1 Zn-dependent hydrolase [Gammaproteobacteria bacterium]